MVQINTDTLAERLFPFVVRAGREIMGQFGSGGAVRQKPDGSPATDADVAAETILVSGLKQVACDVPIIAEEAQSCSTAPDPGAAFFLVDPLDGTREFIAGRHEFSINIGLIVNDQPVFGLIYAPALGEFYATLAGGRAGRTSVNTNSADADFADLEFSDLRSRRPSASSYSVVTSRLHCNGALEAWIKTNPEMDICSRVGSSLKFCALADGRADIYPRFGPTMEWDTAAGHAILLAAGGVIGLMDGSPLRYGKRAAKFENGPFFACGTQETYNAVVNGRSERL